MNNAMTPGNTPSNPVLDMMRESSRILVIAAKVALAAEEAEGDDADSLETLQTFRAAARAAFAKADAAYALAGRPGPEYDLTKGK